MSSPRRLTFAVGTSLLTASLTLACEPKPTVEPGPTHVNEGPMPEPEPEPEESDDFDEDDETGEAEEPPGDPNSDEDVIQGDFPMPPAAQPKS
jgi:hypothetical protein